MRWNPGRRRLRVPSVPGMTSDSRTSETGPFDAWLAHFRANPTRQRAIEGEVDWSQPCTLDAATRAAFVHSFQRFELGEDGDGARLLAKAEHAGDVVYLAALRLLVAEEQRHSALFSRGLEHLGGDRLPAHWSDGAFTLLRRSLGLRTEIALFLVAEVVAMRYFVALEQHAPDPVLRGDRPADRHGRAGPPPVPGGPAPGRLPRRAGAGAGRGGRGVDRRGRRGDGGPRHRPPCRPARVRRPTGGLRRDGSPGRRRCCPGGARPAPAGGAGPARRARTDSGTRPGVRVNARPDAPAHPGVRPCRYRRCRRCPSGPRSRPPRAGPPR